MRLLLDMSCSARCDAPGLVLGEDCGDVGLGFRLTPVDIDKRLAGRIDHLVGAWRLDVGPGTTEAAGHSYWDQSGLQLCPS